MAKNKLTDLRDHLFETLEALRDPDKPMDIARAKAVCEVAQVIINTAKVEVEYIETTGEISGSQFFPDDSSTEKRPRLMPGTGRPA